MPRLPVLVDGDCDSRFNAVKQAFRENFERGWESEGAAFAVYLNDEKVIDLWGGYADASSMRRWKWDTMTLLFSSTKSVCAICFALLVDRRLVKYEDLVTKYWPEFGQNGKETITIDQLLAHQAGLAFVDGKIEEADVKDWTRMSKLFEQQKPNWTPGECVGYHAMTIGWLYDQLVRRIDPKKRSLSTFFKEEIAIPYDIELVIGAGAELEHRIARLSASNKITALREIVQYPIILRMVWNLIAAQTYSYNLLSKVAHNVAWLGNTEFQNVLLLNNPDFRSLEMPSATGMSTARALAKLHSLVTSGKLLKPSTMQRITSPVVVDQLDLVLNIPETKGKGFIFTKNIKDQWMIGHPGMGGQNVKMDPTNKVAFAYISNSVKWGISDYVVTFMRLQNALYQCLNEQNLLGDDSNDVTLVTDVQSAIDATEIIVETDKLLADQRNATKTPSTPVSNADNPAAQKPADQPLQKPKTERTATPSPIQQAKSTWFGGDKLLADQRNATKTPSTPVSNADNPAAQKPADQPLQKPKTERTGTPSPIQQAKSTWFGDDKLLADQRNATKTPSTPVSNADNSTAQKPADQPLQKPKTERTATPSPIQQAKNPVTAKSVAPSSDTSLQTSDNGVKT